MTTACLNGYRYRRRLVVPAASVTGRHEGFPLLVRERGAWLKSRAQGGRVESEAGLDLRFELTDGTRLDHELAHYDPALGELAAWVRVPVLDAAAETGLDLYYGKPGLIVGEADPVAVWDDYLAVWHLPDGTDRSGNERHLVASGTVETVSGPLGRAARLSGSGVFRRPNVAWLDGLTALTCQIWATASDTGHDQGLFTVGPIDGRDSVVDLAVRYVAQGSEESNLLAFIQAQADGRSRLESAAESQTTARQAVSAVWAQGERPVLYLDGAVSAPSAAPAVPRLGRLLVTQGPLTLGAGPRDTAAGGWRGQLDETRLRAAALSAGWLRTEHANLADPQAFYGLGGEQAFGTALQVPLARPVRASTPHGRVLEIDLLATASAPMGAAVAIVAAPANGVAALITGSRLRYTPATGFAGADGLTFTIGSGNQASTARLVIEVTQESDHTDPDQDRPYGGRFFGMGLHAVTPGNTRFYQGTPVAMRFKAERSGTIQGLRWEPRRNTKHYPNPHRYSEGNGGRVVIQLRKDAGGVPDMSSAGLLAQTPPNNGDGRPLCVRAPEWGADYWKVNPARAGHETWSFGSGGAVVAGQVYHLVFTQLEPRAAISINALHNGLAQKGPDWSGPYFGDEMQTMRDAGDGRGFRTSALNSNGPLAHDLIYSDGHVTGTPLTYMGPTEMEIGGNRMVRQRFTVTDYGRTVDGVWLAAYRKGGQPADLLVQLEREDGTALATVRLSATALPVFERDVNAHRWTKVAFGRTCELTRGQTYHLRLSAANGPYFARAGINATDRGGFRNRNICWTKANARAQYSSNGGSSWRNWDIPDWGSFDRPDMSLALLLTVVPD